MKQVEKYLKRFHKKHQGSMSYTPTFRQGWQAALECVRDKMLPNCYESMDIYDFIEEELKE